MMPEMPQMAAAKGQAQDGGPAEFLAKLQSDLQKAVSLFEKSGIGEEELKEFSAAAEQLNNALEGIKNGDSGAEEASEGTATSTPEAGGNPNARPM